MVLARDGSFLIAGAYQQQGYISRISACGKTLWTRRYLFGEETDLNSLAELPSGEVVAVGSCLNCAPGDTTVKALIIKTDPAGLLLADTALGHLNLNAQATDVQITSSGKIAATGQAAWFASLSPNHAVLAIFDDMLHLENWKEHDHFYYDNSQALTQTADGGFVLTGWSSPVLYAPGKAQVFRTDAAGNLLWKYTSPHSNSHFNDVAQTANGQIVALGDRVFDTTALYREIYLAVFDAASGALLAEKTYGSAADDFGESIHAVGNRYLVGGIYGEPSQANWNRRDWVFRLDDQFNLEEQYFRDGYLFAHNLVNALPLSGDGRIFAYYSRTNFFAAHNLLLFKRTEKGYRATVAAAPSNYQLVPRDLATNKGTVTFKGAMADPLAYDELRLDVWRNDALQQTLYDNAPQSFDFAPQITAELAEYHFRLSGIKGQAAVLEAEACDIVAGDAYLIQGQSNAVAGLPIFDLQDTVDHAYRHYRTPFVRNFGLKYDNDTLYAWHKETAQLFDYADNISGQWNRRRFWHCPLSLRMSSVSAAPTAP
ncbi:MAG: hypothetical protein EPGJADBJ_04262 [Saprospiraceae bacterium]|nr:hypothetical protein [Saprospiraceae bacterium]